MPNKRLVIVLWCPLSSLSKADHRQAKALSARRARASAVLLESYPDTPRYVCQKGSPPILQEHGWDSWHRTTGRRNILAWMGPMLDTPPYQWDNGWIDSARVFIQRVRDLGFRAGYARPPTIHGFQAEDLHLIGHLLQTSRLYHNARRCCTPFVDWENATWRTY